MAINKYQCQINVQSSPQQKASQTDKNERKTDPGNRDRTLVVVPKKMIYIFFSLENTTIKEIFRAVVVAIICLWALHPQKQLVSLIFNAVSLSLVRPL